MNVAAGRGLGQARRVVGLEPRADGKVGVRVDPRWDVVPTGAGVRDVVVHHNRIEAMTGPTPSRRCDLPRRLRIGINLDDAALVHHTVLYANQCIDVDQPLRDEGRGTRAICAPGPGPWCECAAPEPGR
jgi:hypothetical protein